MKQSNTNYFYLLRILAIVFVITFHVYTYGSSFFDERSTLAQFGQIFLVALGRNGVSIFFMISGALLINNKTSDSLSHVLKHRVFRIFVYILLGTIIALMTQYYLHGKVYSIVELPKVFIEDQIENRLWFLYIMMGLYMCLPILNGLVKTNDKLILMLTIFCLINVQLKDFVVDFFGVKPDYELPLAGSAYLGAFLTGYLLHKYTLSKKAYSLIYLLGFLAFIINIYLTFTSSVDKGQIVNTYWTNTSIFTYMSAISIFLIFKNLSLTNAFSNDYIKIVSKSTLYVYLIHTTIIDSLVIILGYDKDAMTLSKALILIVLTTIISFIFAVCLQMLEKYILNLINKLKYKDNKLIYNSMH